VEVVDETIEEKPNPELGLNVEKVISGFPSNTKLLLENKTGRALFKTKLTVEGSKVLGLVTPKVIEAGTLLPFAKNSFNLRLRSSSFLENKDEKLLVVLTGIDQDQELKTTTEKSIAVKPFFSFELPQIALLIIFLLVAASWLQPQLPRLRAAFQRQ
jgi:hypothetical protein